MPNKLCSQAIYSRLTVVIFILFAFACKDENHDELIAASQDYAVAESMVIEIFKIVDEAAKSEPQVFKLASLDCATITLEADTSGDFPKTLVIDFGEVNCIGGDGRKRRGIVRATFNDFYSEPGSVVNIAFDNFFINDFKVINGATITNTSNLIQLQHHLSFPGLRFLSADGRTININGSRTFMLTSGEGTAAAEDDEFRVSGSFTGTVRTGGGVTATITDPLSVKYACRSVTSGMLNVSITGTDGAFNYGEGVCDDDATVIIDGRTFFIRLE